MRLQINIKFSYHHLKFRVHKAPLPGEAELCIVLDEETDMAEIRIWYKDILTDAYQTSNSDLNLVKF